MNKALKRILPILLGIVIICSILWYLFSYDRAFTRDMLLWNARYFETKGNHSISAWFYDQAYLHSGKDEQVAIELAEKFKESGNFTQAEITLSRAIADGGSVELYIALCKTYVQQDKLLDAVTMLDNITDSAILDQLQHLRPAAPTADPAPGFYSQYIPVTIQYGSGKLYISTDGVYPSVKAGPSDGNITLANGENTIYAISIGDNGLVSPLSVLGYTVSGVIEEVILQDPVIDEAVRQKLGVSKDVVLLSSDLWTITELSVPAGVMSFADLSALPYLQKLTIDGSLAMSLEGLSSLNYLTDLTVRNSSLRNADLAVIAALPNLKNLTLTECGLSAIDNLSECKGLQYLDLSHNAIRDFSSLSFMPGLTHLNLSHNALTNLNSVSVLSSLTSLDVSYNALVSVSPVAGCPKLQSLNISNNSIMTISGLEKLSALEVLDASFNAINDVTPLGSCLNLKKLNLAGNALTDITCLASLNALEELDFSRNEVTMLPQWSKESALIRIDGSYNQLTVIAPLGVCQNLNYVMMDHNSITSVNALGSCYNLIEVSVLSNPVKDVSALEDMGIIVIYNPL